MEGLCHRRVSVYYVCDVFEQCAHFKGKNKFSMEFSHVASHGLNSKYHVVGLTRSDADEPTRFLRFERECTSIPGEWELAGDYLLSFASSGDRPTETISGSVKTIAGIATLSNSRW